jgi:hypothetical protein
MLYVAMRWKMACAWISKGWRSHKNFFGYIAAVARPSGLVFLNSSPNFCSSILVPPRNINYILSSAMATKYLPLLLLSSLVIAEPHLMVDSPNIGFTNYDWKRQALVQGWALVEDNCPDGTATCGRRSCCPIGSYCDATEDTNSNLCCPTGTSISSSLH